MYTTCMPCSETAFPTGYPGMSLERLTDYTLWIPELVLGLELGVFQALGYSWARDRAVARARGIPGLEIFQVCGVLSILGLGVF